ncbi:MAG: Skp family chaperone for outer membrane protein [Paracoccaceae bacterium]|jgi:Skp family chaperone for outer membrane proteins
MHCVRDVLLKILWLTIVASLVGMGPPSLAQDVFAQNQITAESKQVDYNHISRILTLSPDLLYTGSRFGATVQQRAVAFAKQLADENDDYEVTLAQEEKELTDKRAIMSAAEFLPLAAAFDQKVERIRNEQDEKVRQLAKKTEDNRKYFFDAILPLLAEIMKKSGAEIIVEKSSVFASFDRIDITDEAVSLIDTTLALEPDLSGPLAPIRVDVPKLGN